MPACQAILQAFHLFNNGRDNKLYLKFFKTNFNEKNNKWLCQINLGRIS